MYEALRSIVAQFWLVSGSQLTLVTVAGAAEENIWRHLTSHLTYQTTNKPRLAGT